MAAVLLSRKSLAVFGVSLVLVAAIIGVSIVHAQDQRPQGRGPGLEGNMKAMDKAWKTIQAQVSDKAKNESTLTAVVEMEQATMAAKASPPGLNRLPQDQRDAKRKEFRTMIINLLRTELDLEDQLMDGDNDKAAETVKAIAEIQKTGHQDFNVHLRDND
jgi:Cytochrome b562